MILLRRPIASSLPQHNHLEKTLKLSVTVFPELAELLERERPLEAAGRRKSSIAGVRSKRLPATAFRIVGVRRIGWSQPVRAAVPG